MTLTLCPRDPVPGQMPPMLAGSFNFEMLFPVLPERLDEMVPGDVSAVPGF